MKKLILIAALAGSVAAGTYGLAADTPETDERAARGTAGKLKASGVVSATAATPVATRTASAMRACPRGAG